MKTIQYKVDVNTGSANKGLDQTTKKTKNLGKDVKNVGKQTTDLNSSFAALPGPIGSVISSLKMLRVAMLSSGIGAVVVAAGALAGLFVAATKKGAEFAKQMSTLKAVSGASTEQMNALSASAKDLGATTQFTAIQVGELQTEFAKLGFTTEQILASTEATLNLAASMEVDLASAAMLAGATVSGFGLQAKDTGHVVDVLALSSSTSALGFSELVESLKNVSPAAKGTGKSLEETTAMLGVLANSAIKGGRGGTALKAMFVELKKRGLEFNEAVEIVNNSQDKFLTAQKLASSVGGSALSVLASQTDKIEELTEAYKNADGAARRMAEIRLDNLEGDVTKLGSAWEGLLLSIEDGEGVLNMMVRGIVQWLTMLLGAITTVSTAIGAFIQELNDSFSVIHQLKLAVKLAIDGIKTSFINLGLVISKIPFIGEKIDATALRESKEEIIANVKDTTEQMAYWAGVAEKRRESGLSFFERVQERMNKQQAIGEEEQTEKTEEELKKREEARKKSAAAEQRAAHQLRIARLKAEADEEINELKKFKKLKEIEELKLAFILKTKKLTRSGILLEEFKTQQAILKLEKQFSEKRIDLRKAEIIQQEKQYKKDWSMFGTLMQNKIKADEEAYQKKLENINKDLEFSANAMNSIQAIGDAVFAHKMKNLKEGSKEEQEAAKKQFKFNKALQLGMAIIDAGKAITASLAQAPVAIGPVPNPAGIASLAFATATSAAQIASIAAQRFQGSTSSSTGVPTPNIETGESQAAQFNIVGQSGINQIAGALNQPIQAYVVAQDVTTAQQLDNGIITSATLGGG